MYYHPIGQGKWANNTVLIQNSTMHANIYIETHVKLRSIGKLKHVGDEVTKEKNS